MTSYEKFEEPERKPVEGMEGNGTAAAELPCVQDTRLQIHRPDASDGAQVTIQMPATVEMELMTDPAGNPFAQRGPLEWVPQD